MKKFTKGCLMTALILFLVGLVLSVVCGMLGGFRQLSEMRFSDSYIGLYRNAAGDWRIGFPWRRYDRNDLESIGEIEDIEDIEDVEDVRKVMEKKRKNLEGKKEQLSLTAETLGSLEIDVDECNVVIWKSEDEHVWYLADGNTNRTHYSIENEHGRSKLSIENEVEHHLGHWRSGPNDTVYLWLPEGCLLDECDIEMGAGYMDSIFLNAKETFIDAGAGFLEADGFEGDVITIFAGAGEVLCGRIVAESVVLEIGAGHLSVEELEASRKASLQVSMGGAEVGGTILGDLDLDCDMGEIVMRLTGSEDDHSYDVECGMGNVAVGSYDHGGFASHKTWNSGKNSRFEINCNMGNVEIQFEK